TEVGSWPLAVLSRKDSTLGDGSGLLHCGISTLLLSAVGHKQTSRPRLDYVRFSPESGLCELTSQQITVGATIKPVAPYSFSGCMTNANSKARALARSSRMSTTRQRCVYIAPAMTC